MKQVKVILSQDAEEVYKKLNSEVQTISNDSQSNK